MKRPYDLVSFMKQEERADILHGLKDEMSNKKFDETVDHVVQTSFEQVATFSILENSGELNSTI